MQRNDSGRNTGRPSFILIFGIVCLIAFLVTLAIGVDDQYGSPHDQPPSQTR